MSTASCRRAACAALLLASVATGQPASRAALTQMRPWMIHRFGVREK